MPVTYRGLAYTSVLTFILCAALTAQQESRIVATKLQTSDVGWAATNSHLFWTTDLGEHWKDITPHLEHKRQAVSSVFFLDSSTGWVLLGCADHLDERIDDTCFEVASTTNAGENWSVVHPKLADPDPEAGFSGRTFLDFVDSVHGWMIVKVNRSTAVSFGIMLRTEDGGQTWTELPQPPIAEPFRFVTVRDGWIAGGPNDELYVTHDSGNSWQLVSLPKPNQVGGPDRGVVYDLPVFENEKRGLLSVCYKGGSELGPPFTTVVLFATDDSGKTWNLFGVLPGLLDNSDGWLPLAITESATVTALTDDNARLSLYRLIPGEKPTIKTTAGISSGAVQEISFADTMRGWILTSSELLATNDGGTSWVNVTPGDAVYLPERGVEKRATVRTADGADATRFSNALPASSGISQHLGFDKSRVMTASQMGTLWTYGPFNDVAIYIPGSPNRGLDPTLTSPWVKAVEQQHWGIVPTWFGLQSPCVLDKTGITQFIGQSGQDPTTQGTQQADLAVSHAQKLGITNGVIYLDIESYATDNDGTCSAPVRAYVDAWVSEVHTQSNNVFAAGVYANPNALMNDISQISTIPDEIWIYNPATKANLPQVTVWHQGVTEDLWPLNQRIHQFLTNQHGVTFGGVTIAPSVDEDIEDATILAGTGAKIHSYNFQPINCTNLGAVSTFIAGINDVSRGGFISASGQVGTIIGSYTDSTNISHGFQYDGVSCTAIDYPGAIGTYASGINNQGQVVGSWEDANSLFHGFLLNPGAKPVPIPNYPGAVYTFPYGINDAGQIVGVWEIAYATDFNGFLRYNGTFYPPIEYTGTTGITNVAGINGDGSIIGGTLGSQSVSFVEYAVPPNWDGNFVPYRYLGDSTVGNGINNNGDEVGVYFSGRPAETYGFVLSSGVPTSLQYGASSDTQAMGINDFGQIVGIYQDVDGVFHGFLAMPQ